MKTKISILCGLLLITLNASSAGFNPKPFAVDVMNNSTNAAELRRRIDVPSKAEAVTNSDTRVITLTNAGNAFGGDGSLLTGIEGTNVTGMLFESDALSLTNPANVLVGTFTGDLSGGTNVPRSALVVGSVNTNVIYVWTNVTTSQIQAALDAGQEVIFYPGDYWDGATGTGLTNLYLRTNHCALRGYSSRDTVLHFNLAATNFFISTATNKEFVLGGISGLALSGGQEATNWAGNGRGVTLPLQYPNQIILGNVWYINRNGLDLDINSGGVIDDVVISGFPGYGIYFQNHQLPNSSTYAFPYTRISGLICRTNYFGGHLGVWSYDRFPSGAGADWPAEYMSIMGCQFTYNTFGIGLGAANHTFSGNIVSGNWVGIFASGSTGNHGHGIIANNLINHNTYAIWAYNANDAGEMIINNHFMGGGHLFFDSCKEVIVKGNNFSGTQIVTFTNIAVPSTTGYNFFEENWYQGTWGTELVLRTNSTTSTNYVRGNRSTTLVNSDGFSEPTTNYYSSSDLNPGTGWTRFNPNGASMSPTFASEGMKRTASGTHYLHIPLRRTTRNVTVRWTIQSDVENAVTNTYQCWYFPHDGSGRVNLFSGGTTSNLVLELPAGAGGTNGVKQVSWSGSWPTVTNAVKELQMVWPAATNTSGVIAIIGQTEVVESP